MSRTIWPLWPENRSAERHHSEQTLFGVQHIRIMNRFDQARLRLPAHVRDRFVDGHFRAQPREARTHQSAGVVFLIGHQGRDFTSCRFIQHRHETRAFFFRNFLNHVGGVVRSQKPHPDSSFADR